MKCLKFVFQALFIESRMYFVYNRKRGKEHIMCLIKLKAKAKVNFSLDVIRKRSDGYHEVRMIMQTIELHDTVFIEAVKEGIEVVCSSRFIPSGGENIAYKAAGLLVSEYGIKSGVSIRIDKRIPVAAGLAGGSADAAAVFLGMNRLFSLGLSEDRLMALGKRIGADVPFCIKGGTMLAEGIGEVLTELAPIPQLNIVLIKPAIGVSTAWAYRKFDMEMVSEHPDTEGLLKAVCAGNVDFLANNMRNVLETVTLREYPIVKEAKDRLMMLGAVGSMMSGSGPTVFGIFKDKQAAECALKGAYDKRWECFLTCTG